MKKDKKLSLEDLEVESFVTSLESKEKETINGEIGGFLATIVITSIVNSALFGNCPTGDPNGLLCNPDGHIPDMVPDREVNSNHPRWCPR